MAPAPEEKLSEVCQRLDQLVLLLMEDLETLQEKRERLNGLIEKGWFLLSQSRYSMGNKFVSSLQYTQDMVASVCVRDSAEDDDGARSFHVEHIEPGRFEDQKPEALLEVEDVGAADQVLRHRGTSETQKPPKTEKTEKPKPPPSHDPLRWFGVLVPQSLRQAQSTFRQGVALSAEVTSLQSSIDETRRQYRTLLARKKEIQARSG
ncbi:coiled-coil domain-containing protein 115 [Pseudophryne corroboree]|uniref:coiled-coil domain-containing protein 115 n=1 Tax=Pseudophryne corroboree TaxID=495146 RepID=UPI003081D6BF